MPTSRAVIDPQGRLQYFIDGRETDEKLTAYQSCKLRQRWNEQTQGAAAGGTPILSFMPVSSRGVSLPGGVAPEPAGSAINPHAAGRQPSKFWTAPRIAILEHEWLAGKRVIEIAAAIGDGCTRNMVISKARRLALPKRTPAEISAANSLGQIEYSATPSGIQRAERYSNRMQELWQTPDYRNRMLKIFSQRYRRAG